jgi:tetratricopeptide (TPR) repeat protein
MPDDAREDAQELVDELAELPRRAEWTYHPWVGMYVCTQSGHVNLSDPVMRENAGFHLVLAAMVKPGPMIEPSCPGRVTSSDRELLQYLRRFLEPIGVRVDYAEDDAPLDEFMRFMTRGPDGREQPPGAMDGKGVTLEALQSFAEAARLFWAAAPWEWLSDDDLFQVESPTPPEGLGFFVVMGAGREAYGVAFFKNRNEHRKIAEQGITKKQMYWAVNFNRIDQMPIADAELFESGQLTPAADGVYPVATGVNTGSGKVRRPDAEQLAHMEALLRALATITEEQAVKGDFFAWTEDHARGRNYFRFLMPNVREELDWIARHVPNGLLRHEAEEWAARLVARSFDTWGLRRRVLSLHAAGIAPHLVEPYLSLAAQQQTPRRSTPWYEKAAAVAERNLTREAIEANAGHLGRTDEGAIYLRALAGLADTLMHTDQPDRAADIYREVLRLDASDPQQVRPLLVAALYEASRLDELAALLDDPASDQVGYQFHRALLAFRRHGDSPEARAELEKARKRNKYVEDFLVGRRPMPQAHEVPLKSTPGRLPEAKAVAFDQAHLWDVTAGAIEWLQRMMRPPGAKKKRKKG